MSSLADRLAHLHDEVELRREDLHDYQAQKAFNFLLENPFSALFIDTGLGKTIICLTLIAHLIEHELMNRVLVVAPVRVAAQTWPNELKEWEHVCWLRPTVIRAEDDDPEVTSAGEEAVAAWRAMPDAKQKDALRKSEAVFACTPEEVAALKKLPNESQYRSHAMTAKKNEIRLRKAQDGATFHIINIEALEWLIDLYSKWVPSKSNKNKLVRKIVGWPYDVVILDESSKFKEFQSYRWKALAAVRVQGGLKRLHELTATPAAESYLGLWAQAFLMDLGERLGRNITAYRTNFFMQSPYSRFVWKIQSGAEEKISALLADISLVMKSEDYLDEQKPLFLPRKLKMEPWQAKIYRQMETEFVATLPANDDNEEVEIEAETAAALSAKLLQLASGAVYPVAGSPKFHVIHNHKIDDLKQLREEVKTPIMVAYWYKSNLARLRKAFPKAVVMDETGKCVTPWNKGEIDMLLVHPAGVGHGLNMQKGPGHDIYFFDMCWSYELYYQLYRRLHRQGQKQRVRVHLPQMVSTGDEVVAKRLLAKKDAQEVFFRWVMTFSKRMQEMKVAA